MSTPQPDDVSLAAKIMSGLGVALTGAVTWMWHHTHRRISDVDKKTDTKADANEVDRHRDYIAKLFDKVQELGDKTEVRFSVMEKQSFERHIELLNAINQSKRR